MASLVYEEDQSINTHFTRVPKSLTFTNQSIEKAINLSSTNKFLYVSIV